MGRGCSVKLRLENKEVLLYKKGMERPDNCPSPDCFIIHILPKVDKAAEEETIRSSCKLCIQLADNQRSLDKNIENLLKSRPITTTPQPNS